ncbi:hypothetical protein ACFFNY_21770 [Paenibacillus hodogayensis]|uniref:Peptidase S24/S26A/S26B/S26C domain-containing protein n=1 Tax=Paenibacillus hodogayensis TaxID=279208 RepID=A0ABV5W1U0_9BACL
MNPTKIIPVVTDGYTRKWFGLDMESSDLAYRPHLSISGYSDALFALSLDDEGLESLGVKRGDYLLFSTKAALHTSGQIALIRQEEDYMIREAYWNGDVTLLRVPGEAFPPIMAPTENIRITAVLDTVIANDKHAPLVRFR